MKKFVSILLVSMMIMALAARGMTVPERPTARLVETPGQRHPAARLAERLIPQASIMWRLR